MKKSLRRMERLADANTLHLIEHNRSAVSIASARVEGIPLVFYAFDEEMRGGALGYMEGRSVLRAMRLAETAGVPLVGLIASAGADLIEGKWALLAAARLFRAAYDLTVPHLFLAYGACLGAAAYLETLADAIFAVKGRSYFALTGPKVVQQAIFERCTLDGLGGAERVASRGGVHFLGADQEEMEAALKKFLSFVKRPVNRRYLRNGRTRKEDPNLTVDGLITHLIDPDSAQPIWSHWAKQALAMFAYVDGRRLGIFANQRACAGGVLDRESALKGAAFYRLADRFDIPVLNLVDTPGFLPGVVSESEGVLEAGGELVQAYLSHGAKKATVAIGRVLGGAYMAMGNRAMGADGAAAFSEAEIGVMGPEIAAAVLKAGEDQKSFYRNTMDAEAALERGLVDRLIAPEELKGYVKEVLF